jgi:intraflagellar transport protein 56
VQAIVQLSLGQASGSQEQLKAAQQYFQVVGSSPSECDTIPGRQAMASCFFMLKQYEDVLVFLSVSARTVYIRRRASLLVLQLVTSSTQEHCN